MRDTPYLCFRQTYSSVSSCIIPTYWRV